MGPDTIAAPATPPGQGGIGIIRISGPEAHAVLRKVFLPRSKPKPGAEPFPPWTLRRGSVIDRTRTRLDDALAVFMPGPRTFTGEDVAELHCHGSPALLGLILDTVLQAGARLADRGEFSRRAFLNGRMDLSQAEAVAELIAAPGPEAARWASARLDGRLRERMDALRDRLDALRAQVCLAVDFPDDEVDAALTPAGFTRASDLLLQELGSLIAAFERTRHWREGLVIALAGPVNAGKSSLLNALLGRNRALVSDSPGTTRDYLEEPVNLGGLPARLVDTAGLRGSAEAGELEAQGMELGRRMIAQADLILILIDGLNPDKDLTARLLEEFGPERSILLWNKTDRSAPAAWMEQPPCSRAAARVSIAAKTGEGLELLLSTLRTVAAQSTGAPEAEPDLLVPNLRQTEALRRAVAELEALRTDVLDQVPWDLCAVRLEGVAAALDDVTGQSTADDILNRIFATFCIGK